MPLPKVFHFPLRQNTAEFKPSVSDVFLYNGGIFHAEFYKSRILHGIKKFKVAHQLVYRVVSVPFKEGVWQGT